MIFFYFVPEADKFEAIRDSRFWDVPAGEITQQRVESGPSGQPGYVCYYAPFGTKLKTAGYSKDSQEWIDCNGYWLGWERDSKPAPDSLQRKNLVSGYDRRLNDGNLWHCPTARKWTDDGYIGNIPVVRTLIGGEKGVKVKPEFREFWELSGKLWDQFQQKTVDGFEQFKICVTCLQINYRVGPEECSVLEIFDDVAMVEIFKATLDVDAVVELNELKKKERSAVAG